MTCSRSALFGGFSVADHHLDDDCMHADHRLVLELKSKVN
jgi:hypothetical protein